LGQSAILAIALELATAGRRTDPGCPEAHARAKSLD